MRLYEQRNNPRSIQCNYCYKTGHNKRNCPTMKAHWDANPQVHETYDHDSVVGVDKTMFPTHYQQWYGDDNARNEFRSHWQYMKTRFAEKPKARKPRKATKCGFCGEEGHTRRNCKAMKNFVHVLNETNRGYRSAFYDRFVEGLGLGAGALIQVQPHNSEPTVSMITSFPTDNIMFTNLKSRWSDFHTKMNVEIMLGDRKCKRNLFDGAIYHPNYHDEFNSLGLWSAIYGSWGMIQSVVSPAPNRPTKEWFMGQAPCFDWVVKKRGYLYLMHEFSTIIKEFYPHDDLKEKLGGEVYGRFYR
jgi:hypothetical protein